MSQSLPKSQSQSLPETYLVTGAAGFIGSQFVESCNKRGISLISVDLPAHFELRKEHLGLQFGQIVDRENLSPWLESHRSKINGIFHLGAVTDTRETDLERLNHLNFEYSCFLWKYASQSQIPFLYASSAATYGDGSLGFDDNESLIPQLKALNPYGDSKLRFDRWVLEQERQGNHPPHWAGFKFFNVYGFGEGHKGFMSSVVLHAFEEIREKGRVTLFRSHKPDVADGLQKRDFVCVRDVVDVLHFAFEHPIRRGIFNLGTGHARSFLDLARAVFAAMGRKEEIHWVDTPLSVRDKYQYFTEAKMARLRQEGYQKPFTPLEDGVKDYIARMIPPRSSSAI